MNKLENHIIKRGEFNTTPDELAKLPFDTLKFMSEHSENHNVFRYHLLIHKDCPTDFFKKYWESTCSNITNGRLKMVKHVKILTTEEMILFVLRMSDSPKKALKERYPQLINDGNSSLSAVFKKNPYTPNDLKYQLSGDITYLPEEVVDTFIF